MSQIPNLLTVLRILLAPVLAYAVSGDSLNAAVASLALVMLIELTDWLDGMLARRYGWQSRLGRFMDPLADSLARMTAFAALAVADGLVPLAFLLCYFYRDQFVAYLRIDAAQRGVDVGARKSGKLKAVIQGLVVGLICIGRIAAHPEVGRLDPATLVLWAPRLVAVAAVFTLYSAWDYYQGFKKSSVSEK